MFTSVDDALSYYDRQLNADVVELVGEARFELKRQLADTLQGRIYSAIDRNTGEYCVVKETWKQLVKLGKSRDGQSVPENFEEEKRILKMLSSQKDAHVRLIDEWEDKDCYLYAMEMCGGGELFEYIKGMHSDGAVAHYTRPQSRLKQEMTNTNEWMKVVPHMFEQIVSSVAWMHSKGVCHLDMSLENAMIANRSKKYGNGIKIIDFGPSRHFPDNKFKYNKRIGKTGYMSPEVYARKEYFDPRAADIWSLGVMLFMMTREFPNEYRHQQKIKRRRRRRNDTKPMKSYKTYRNNKRKYKYHRW